MYSANEIWSKMDTEKIAQLSTATRRQYRNVVDRFCRQYNGPLTSTAIQTHITDTGLCLYTRILRTLFNNFYTPLSCVLNVTRQRNNSTAVMSYLLFIPHYIRQNDNFPKFVHQLRSYIDICQPELRNQTNVRYQISLLWNVLQHEAHIESASENDVLTAIARVCLNEQQNASLNKVAHVVRVVNKYLQIQGHTGPSFRRAYCFVKGRMHTNGLIMHNNKVTNAIKQRHAIGKVLTTMHVDQMKQCKKSARDEAIFTLMLETGLRRRAVSWMTLHGVVDGEDIRPFGYATEKGLRMRYFPISNALRSVLKTYISMYVHTDGKWLFPKKGDNSDHISTSTVRNVIRRICIQSCIPAHLSHCHIIRRFVVCELMRAGNTIEQVSKWLGHQSVNTTYNHYWHLSIRDLQSQMRIPWLTDGEV